MPTHSIGLRNSLQPNDADDDDDEADDAADVPGFAVENHVDDDSGGCADADPDGVGDTDLQMVEGSVEEDKCAAESSEK